MVDFSKINMLQIAAKAVGLAVSCDSTGVRFYVGQISDDDEDIIFEVKSIPEAHIFLAGWTKGRFGTK